MEAYIPAIASFIIVTIGGAIMKLFIDRAFKGIDEGMKGFNMSVKSLEKELEELWDYANQIHEDIIRLQGHAADTSKMSDLKAEFIEKFQTSKDASSDFNMLLTAINSLAAKFEKLEEKTLKLFSKNRDNSND